VNKFEALKQFQAWPPEWQRLCAEYWIETGEVDSTQVSTFGERLSVSPIPIDQPRAAKAAATQGCTPIYRGEFGIIEREYLAKCHHETSTRRDAANMFLDRYPGRSVQAVEIKIRKMLDASGVMHVRY
jgi:hypothetical protein